MSASATLRATTTSAPHRARIRRRSNLVSAVPSSCRLSPIRPGAVAPPSAFSATLRRGSRVPTRRTSTASSSVEDEAVVSTETCEWTDDDGECARKSKALNVHECGVPDDPGLNWHLLSESQCDLTTIVKFRRNHEWREYQSSKRWFQQLTTINGSVVARRVTFPALVITAWAVAVRASHHPPNPSRHSFLANESNRPTHAFVSPHACIRPSRAPLRKLNVNVNVNITPQSPHTTIRRLPPRPRR